MKKQILALSVCALLALPLSAQADWMTAPENRFYTEGGTIAARISLTSGSLSASRSHRRAPLPFISCTAIRPMRTPLRCSSPAGSRTAARPRAPLYR